MLQKQCSNHDINNHSWPNSHLGQGCIAEENLGRVEKLKNVKRNWKRKQWWRFNKTLSHGQDGEQLFLILSDDRTRGNGLRLCHEGLRLPREAGEGFLAVTALKHCEGLRGNMTVSLEFFKKSDWIHLEIIRLHLESPKTKQKSFQGLLMNPWVSTQFTGNCLELWV